MKPERNDPCPCGSGKKYKKCCAAAGTTDRPGAHSLARAVALFQDGRLDDALVACSAVLQQQPMHAGALELAGFIHYGTGEFALARQFLGRALAVNPQSASAHTNIAQVLCSLGELDAAQASAYSALALDAQNAEAHNILGNVLAARAAWTDAARHYRFAIASDPSHAFFHHNLGHALQQAGDAGAEAAYRKAISLDPKFSPAYANLGGLLVKQERCEEALDVLRRAIALDSENIDAYNNLGLASRMLGDLTAAFRYYRLALERNPNVAGIWHNLGLLYEEGNHRVDAAACYKRATELDTDFLDAQRDWLRLILLQGDLDTAHAMAGKLMENQSGLAAVLPIVFEAMGRSVDFSGRDRAIELFRQFFREGRYAPHALTSLLVSLLYPENIGEAELQGLHRAWGQAIEREVGDEAYSSWSSPQAAEPLRIGYLSPDFRRHSVGYFIQHVLAQHDRRCFEVHCYANQRTRDDVTQAIRASVTRYTEVRDLTDAQLAQRIHDDGIHILVDLAGHSAETRLNAFVFRPAPVQITWIGYLNNTGLPSMDYRITDPHADDPVANAGPEKLLVLPDSFLCFGSFPECQISPIPPAIRNGYVTFASFNNLSKLTGETVRVWARILARLPAARLMIMAAEADSETVSKNLRREFANHGIVPDRIDFKPSLPRQLYLAVHNEVDIVLDTWPFNGGTVTAGALWMGVPVVTLVGTAHRQRVSYSMLKNIGVEQTITWNEDAYLETAVSLAQDPAALSGLRQRIARNIRASILCDPPRFTRQLETALECVWSEYAAKKASSILTGH